MLLFIVIHEIEHSYQYLMVKVIKESPCKLVADAYNILFAFLMQSDNEMRKNLISHFFHELMCSQLAIGYVKNNKGSFEETFRNILMLKKYRQLDHDFDLLVEERIRYGLPISKDIRRKN